MSKQETLIIKGIAILMMLFLHLFNNGSANQLQHLLWIDNQPFLQILTRAANPIFFFCFCGGYGLYYTYHSPFYMFGMIVLILLIQRRTCTDKWLAHLGNLSMEMWLIHSWFCYYLFRDFFYGLKYPIVVFLVLLATSYASAVIVRFIGSRILRT